MRIGAGAAGAQGRRKWFPSSPEGLFCHVEEFARVSSAKGETSKASGPGRECGERGSEGTDGFFYERLSKALGNRSLHSSLGTRFYQ